MIENDRILVIIRSVLQARFCPRPSSHITVPIHVSLSFFYWDNSTGIRSLSICCRKKRYNRTACSHAHILSRRTWVHFLFRKQSERIVSRHRHVRQHGELTIILIPCIALISQVFPDAFGPKITADLISSLFTASEWNRLSDNSEPLILSILRHVRSLNGPQFST